MARPSSRSLVAVFGLILACAGVASAQVVQRPPRAYRTLFGPPVVDPNRSRQEFSVTGSLLGGYDDNLTPISTSPQELFTPRPSGFSGIGEARARYLRGRQARSLELLGGGAVYAYRGLDLAPEYAADAQARFTVPVGRRHRLLAVQGIRSEPFYLLGAFAPLLPGLDLDSRPATTSASGFSVRRSRVLDSTVSFQASLSRDHLLTMAAGYNDRTFDDDFGNSRAVSGSADYTYMVGRASGFRATYRFADSENLNEDGINRPIEYHVLSGGYTYEKHLSATRRFQLIVGGGTTHVKTTITPFEYWTPSAYASTRFDWARSWSVWLDYSRRVAVLEGLSVDPYTTDSLVVWTGGLVHPRVEVVGSGTWSNGQAAPDNNGRFDTYSASSQVRLLLARWYSFVLSHSFYAHRLNDFTTLPAGMITRLDQHIVRVGLTFDLPLYGRYLDRVRP
ncbi:MAG: hypothetical protein AB7Q16_19575 [Vicinamibacterales bacterium]